MKSHTLPLVASLLALASATPEPGFFDDVKSAWDGAKSDLSADASSVRADLSSAWASATATASSSSSSSSSTSTSTTTSHPTSTATAAQNLTDLIYPRCSPDASRAWCGIVFGGNVNSTTNNSNNNSISATYNVSITDSACRQVAVHRGVQPGAAGAQSFSTDVGNWTFGVISGGGSSSSGIHGNGNGTVGGGLNMTYEGRNISDYQSVWDSWAIEDYNPSAGSIVIYGAITNCTAADKETSHSSSSSPSSTSSSSSSAAAEAAVVPRAGVAFVAVVVGMLGLAI